MAHAHRLRVLSTIAALTAIASSVAVAPSANAGLNYAFHAVALNGSVNAASTSQSGRVLIGGTFTLADGQTVNRIAMLNPDGSLDQSFVRGITNGGNIGFDGAVTAIRYLGSDTWVVAGTFTSVKGFPVGRIVLITRVSDGWAAVNAFGTGFDGPVYALAAPEQGGDYLVAVGAFSQYQGTAVGEIAKISSFSGVLDTTFNTRVGTGLSGGPAYAAHVQDDGHIVVGGSFTSASGITRKSVARFKAGGTLDTGFVPIVAGGLATVRAVSSFAGDGPIVIGGSFTSVTGSPRDNLAYLNSDGSLTTLAQTSGANGTVYALARQAGGAVVAGGTFTQYGLTPVGRVAKILPNGYLMAWGAGSGSYGTVLSVSNSPDARLLIGGTFAEFDGLQTDGHVVQLNDSPARPYIFSAKPGNASAIISLALPLAASSGSPLSYVSVSWRRGPSLYGSCTPVTVNLALATVTCTGLTNGAVHTINASVCNLDLNCSLDYSVTVTPRTTPSAVRLPKVTYPAVRKAKVSWTAPASNGGAVISRYEYCRASCGTAANWKSTGSPAKAFVLISSLTKGTKYTVKVRARNVAGTGPAVSVTFTQAK